jgi:type IV secretion system protein VirB6
MAGVCLVPSPDDPLVQSLIGSTDCHVQELVRSGYGALFASGGVYGSLLTALMTAYVALIGYRLLLGRGGLAIGEVAMTAVKIGVVLSLATQWGTYQTVVYRALFDGPAQIGDVVLHDLAAKGVLDRGDVFDGLQRAYDDLTAFSPAAPPGQPTAAAPTPPAALAAPSASLPAGQNAGGFLGKAGFDSILLLVSAIALLLSTLGVLLVSKLVLGFLLALGPIFVALLLFDSTRGVFFGWLRASLGFAFAPLSTSVLLGVGLSLLQPSLDALEDMKATGAYTPGVAYSVLVLVLVLAGVSLGLLIAAGLVAGGLKPARARQASAASAPPAPAPAQAEAAVLTRGARTAHAAEAQARRDQRLFGAEPNGSPSNAGERRFSLSVLAGSRSAAEPIAVASRLGQAPRRNAQPRTPSRAAAPGART